MTTADSKIPFNHTAHQALWDWLAHNPGKVKADWPGWNGVYAEEHCYACQYVHDLRQTVADGWWRKHWLINCAKVCPLQWGRDYGCYGDQEPLSAYVQWAYTNLEYRKHAAMGSLDHDRRLKPLAARLYYLAITIKTLPVREGVVCI